MCTPARKFSLFTVSVFGSFCQSPLHWQHFLLMWHLLPELFKSTLWHSAICVACPNVYHTLAWVSFPTRTIVTSSNWPGELLDFACKRSMAHIWSQIWALLVFSSFLFCCMPRKMYKCMQWQFPTRNICTGIHQLRMGLCANKMTNMRGSVYFFFSF